MGGIFYNVGGIFLTMSVVCSAVVWFKDVHSNIHFNALIKLGMIFVPLIIGCILMEVGGG